MDYNIRMEKTELIIEAIEAAHGKTVTIPQLHKLTEYPEAEIKQLLTEYMIRHPRKIMRNPGGYIIYIPPVPSRIPTPFKPYVPPRGMGERCTELYPKDTNHITVGPTGKEISSTFAFKGHE